MLNFYFRHLAFLSYFLISAFSLHLVAQTNTDAAETQYKNLPPFEVKTFGNISREELEMEAYEPDTNASAVVLYRQIYVDAFKADRGREATTYYWRYKIFTQSAIDDFNLSFFSYNRRKTNLEEVEAVIQNIEPDGSISETRLTEDDIVEQRDGRDISVSFALPNLRIGSVIDLKYTFRGGTLSFSPMDKYPVHFMQAFVMIPLYFTSSYQYDYKGQYQPTNIKKSGVERGYEHLIEYQMIPARPSGYFLPPSVFYMPEATLVETYRSFFGFQINSSSWRDLYNVLKESDRSGNNYDKNKKKYASLLEEELPAALKEPDEKKRAEMIYNYILDSFVWNRYYNPFGFEKLKELIEDQEREGDTGDLTYLFMGLLKATGIESVPILTKSRRSGYIDWEAPDRADFNSTMALIRYSDGTEQCVDFGSYGHPMDYIPFWASTGEGFLLDYQNGRWTEEYKIQYSQTKNEVVRLDCEIDGEGNLTGTVAFDFVGIMAEELGTDLRQYIQEDEMDTTEALQEILDERFLDNLEEVSVTDLRISHMTGTYGYTISGTLELSDQDVAVEKIDDELYIKPFFLAKYPENPVPLSEQRDQVYFFGGLYTKSIQFSLSVPDGYELVEAIEPSTVRISGNKATYNLNGFATAEQISTQSVLTVFQPVFSPKAKEELNQFFNLVVDGENALIILQKK